MSSNSPQDVNSLLEEAVDAHLSRDLERLRRVCEKSLRLSALSPQKEAQFRRFYAFALNGLSFQEGQDKRSLRRRAIDEAKKAISLFGESAEPYHLSAAYGEYGEALNLYSMSVDDADEKNRLLRESLQAFERVLQLKPGDEDALKNVTSVKKKLSLMREDQESARSGKGCFIATAAYGSPLADEVTVLRAYRDEVLERRILGRVFVSTYYRLSPPIAHRLESANVLRSLSRLLLRPVVFWAGKKLHRRD
jgi:hypothetical protein